MRTFIAVDVKNEKVIDILNELGKLKADLKLVKPENLHITLKFLGEVAEAKIGKIYDVMESSFSRFKPFSISLFGIGVFSSLKNIRVVWIGLKNKETLIEMNEALENNLRHLGFKEERRKFDPHLTIARTRSSRGKDELKNFVIKNSNKELGTCFIQSVKLKKSTLTPTGPIYQTIKEVKLS